MQITAISDLHGHYPKLEGGDLLIIAGDLTATDELYQYMEFREWLRRQNYTKKIFICGNHDNKIANGFFYFSPEWIGAEYLCDSGTEFEYYNPRFPEEDEGFLPSGKGTLKVWGSPWTLRFEGMNPHCMAFTVDTEEELAEKWALIPSDVNILVTHSPPFHGKWYGNEPDCASYGPGAVYDRMDKTISGEHVGSRSLSKKCDPDAGIRLHVFGHVHEGYGHYHEISPIFEIDLVNASHVNERYEPVNKPIRITL